MLRKKLPKLEFQKCKNFLCFLLFSHAGSYARHKFCFTDEDSLRKLRKYLLTLATVRDFFSYLNSQLHYILARKNTSNDEKLITVCSALRRQSSHQIISVVFRNVAIVVRKLRMSSRNR